MATAGVDQLAGELSSGSLFAPQRLVVVRDSGGLLEEKESGKREAEALLACLRLSWDRDTSLVLCAATPNEPRGPLADYIRAHGSFTWIALPPPPKPWEAVRLSEEQRRALKKLLERTVPRILEHRAVVDVLLDHLGFKPRLLVQTAERLLLAGQLDPQQVRDELGPGERSIDEMEKALVERDTGRLARFLATLAAGGELVNWRGERIPPSGIAAVLSSWLNRLLRGALAMREYARRGGLEKELDAARCADRRWYPTTFQKRIHPVLEGEIASTADGELADASVWQRHRIFRLAASYSEGELRLALARLSRFLPERESDGGVALAMLANVLLGLASVGSTTGDRARGG